MPWASETKPSGAFTIATATVGDFIVGVAQRHNQANTLTVAAPYIQTNITAGNLTAITGHQIVSSDGLTAPSFSGLVQSESFAAFAAIPEPGSMGLIALGGMILFRRRR